MSSTQKSSNEKPIKKTQLNYAYLVAGIAGGAAATAVFHPLELIKIRYQVNEFYHVSLFKKKPQQTKTLIKDRPQYRNLIDSFRRIHATENGIKGLYKGLSINVLASGTAWGMYFLIYNTLKSSRSDYDQSNQTHSIDKDKVSAVWHSTIDATISGVTTILITNPLFLIKTRMCLQYASSANTLQANTVIYKNSFDALKTILQSDGFRGLYKGIIPGLFGTINGTIQMVSYDFMKSIWSKHLKKWHNSSELSSWDYLVFSGVSKCLAVVCTYPFQLIRTRTQEQHRSYRNLREVISITYKNEGFLAFYKGLFPCLLRVTPAASLTFLVYENLLKLLLKQ